MLIGISVGDPEALEGQRVPWKDYPGIELTVRPIPPAKDLALNRQFLGSKQRIRFVKAAEDAGRREDREITLDNDQVEQLAIAQGAYALVEIHGPAELLVKDAAAAESWSKAAGAPIVAGGVVKLGEQLRDNEPLRRLTLQAVPGLLKFVLEEAKRQAEEAGLDEEGKGRTS